MVSGWQHQKGGKGQRCRGRCVGKDDEFNLDVCGVLTRKSILGSKVSPKVPGKDGLQVDGREGGVSLLWTLPACPPRFLWAAWARKAGRGLVSNLNPACLTTDKISLIYGQQLSDKQYFTC